MRRFLPIAVFFWFFFFLFLPGILAVTITSEGVPSTVDQNQEFEITASLSCKNCDVSYLRGVFYPSGTSYFGYTQNKEGNWINASGGSCTQYYPVFQSDMSEESTWSGKIKVKPDTTSSLFNGPGDYLFKIGRYSSSCGSATWSQEVTIGITGPTHTPIPTQTPIPTNTQSPTKTSTPLPTQTSTLTPQPTETKMATPTRKPSSTIVPEKKEYQDIPIGEHPSVLGETTEMEESSPSADLERNKIFIISLAFIGSGLAVLTTAVAYRTILLQKN